MITQIPNILMPVEFGINEPVDPPIMFLPRKTILSSSSSTSSGLIWFGRSKIHCKVVCVLAERHTSSA
jgi:hypothetical protein